MHGAVTERVDGFTGQLATTGAIVTEVIPGIRPRPTIA